MPEPEIKRFWTNSAKIVLDVSTSDPPIDHIILNIYNCSIVLLLYVSDDTIGVAAEVVAAGVEVVEEVVSGVGRGMKASMREHSCLTMPRLVTGITYVGRICMRV